MTVRKLYRSPILRPEFAGKLQAEAAKYAHIERARSKKMWYFGSAVNREWDNLDEEMRAEINRDQFFAEVSAVINSALDFPIIGQSGETLRRWCNVAEFYGPLAFKEEFKEALSFDHFFRAKMLYTNGKVPAAIMALASAYDRRWTAEEMVRHYDPDPVTEYDRVMGSLDAWEGYKFEWLSKDSRERIARDVKDIRETLEAK